MKTIALILAAPRNAAEGSPIALDHRIYSSAGLSGLVSEVPFRIERRDDLTSVLTVSDCQNQREALGDLLNQLLALTLDHDR